ncbi:MAG: VWA domain-containing protein [Chitinophagaceae bacterium]|nr:VWA domain-containing protein [Oligoflexus sp.]
MKIIKSIAYLSTAMSLSMLAVSCNSKQQGFAGSTTVAKTPDKSATISADSTGVSRNKVYVSNDMEKNASNPFPLHPGTLTLAFDYFTVHAATISVTDKKPLSIYFVLDRTQSMDPYIAAVKNGIKQFASNLLSNGYDAKLGLVAFGDAVEQAGPLTDVDTFIANVAKVRAAGGDDAPEGSLAALASAATALAVPAISDKTTPIMVLVTDQIGHNGGGPTDVRDFSPLPLEAALKTSGGQKIKFFYSAPTDRYRNLSNFCPSCTFTSAAGQYGEILANASTVTGSDFRGSVLNWPFDDTVLNTQLAQLINTKLIATVKSCKATDVTLKMGAQIVGTWTAADWTLGEGSIITLNKPLGQDAVASLANQDAIVQINRCCTDGPAAACVSTQSMTIPVNFAE